MCDFAHLFDIYLLNINYMLGSVLGAMNKEAKDEAHKLIGYRQQKGVWWPCNAVAEVEKVMWEAGESPGRSLVGCSRVWISA